MNCPYCFIECTYDGDRAIASCSNHPGIIVCFYVDGERILRSSFDWKDGEAYNYLDIYWNSDSKIEIKCVSAFTNIQKFKVDSVNITPENVKEKFKIYSVFS